MTTHRVDLLTSITNRVLPPAGFVGRKPNAKALSMLFGGASVNFFWA